MFALVGLSSSSIVSSNMWITVYPILAKEMESVKVSYAGWHSGAMRLSSYLVMLMIRATQFSFVLHSSGKRRIRSPHLHAIKGGPGGGRAVLNSGEKKTAPLRRNWREAP